MPRSLEKLTEDELQQLADTITDEEFEQLDELSKGTLSKYMGKNVDDYERARHTGGSAQPAAQKRMGRRRAGMSAAAKKYMAKCEEVEEDNLDEETAAQASIKAKSIDMSKIMTQMAGMDHKDITKIVDILDQVGKETSKLPDRANAGSNRHSVDAVADAKKATMFQVKEDLKAIFDGVEGLNEEVTSKIETLFEAAVNMRVTLETEQIMEEQAAVVEELVEERLADIEEKLDDYLSYVVEEWKEENKIALESGIRMNQMEAFMEDLLTLMSEHNIDLPDEKVDVVEELLGEIDELTDKLNEQIDRNIENQKIIDEAIREEAFDEVTEGLADTQVEKLRTLTEGLEYNDIDDFKKKVSTLRDAHFKEVKVSNISENIDNSDKNNDAPAAKITDPAIARYSAAIKDSVKFHQSVKR